MFSILLKSIFGSKNDRFLNKYKNILSKVNYLGLDFCNFSDLELKEKFLNIKKESFTKESLVDILPVVYALVREVSFRVLKLKHYDVQILAGIALYDNKIIEVATGEGKTLIATLPVCLLSLLQKSVHVVTVNDYLAKRDAVWMSPIYSFFDITVGVLSPNMSVIDKKKVYSNMVVYGTCSEFGFDYLRDNIVVNSSEKVQTGLFYAILDEVDSILIDEARTPLIISSSSKIDHNIYLSINKIALSLFIDKDFILDEKNKQVHLTDIGFSNLEIMFINYNLLKKNDILYDINNINLLHDVYAALKAIYFFKKDIDYIVKDNLILIIDENTGRIMDGRRWSDGLHQAIEAKEKVKINSENQVLASITFQNYFRLYEFISGMTGTAATEAGEFMSIYALDVIVIPTNRKCIRIDHPDLIFMTKKMKFNSVINDIKTCNIIGQPVLVGTVSIAVSEFISDMLNKINIKHNVLNAKNHEKESQIIAEAGRYKSVTIATNMAGRGTDIVLGGKNSDDNSYKVVVELGGLRVIGTERHESRRIDNQLRGRCGRQGDSGSSQFYLSLEDDLVRIFVGDSISSILNKLKISDNEVISHSLVNKSIEKAQKKVESRNFDIRKQLLEFDDIFNEQRTVFYSYRNFIISYDSISNFFSDNFFSDIVDNFCVKFNFDFDSGSYFNLIDSFNLEFGCCIFFEKKDFLDIKSLKNLFIKELSSLYYKRRDFFESDFFVKFEKILFLNVLDSNWREHLLNLDYLKKGIYLRSYANQDPKQEYKRESFILFENMLLLSKYDFFLLLLKLPIKDIFDNSSVNVELNFNNSNNLSGKSKITKNSLCYCNSGKKYKYCHGKD